MGNLLHPSLVHKAPSFVRNFGVRWNSEACLHLNFSQVNHSQFLSHLGVVLLVGGCFCCGDQGFFLTPLCALSAQLLDA